MPKKEKNLDQFILTLGDFLHHCFKKRRIVLSCAFGLALFAFAYFLLSIPVYTFEGTYLDKGKSSSAMSQSFSELMMMAPGKLDSEAVSFMKSRKLLERVISNLGGQASLSQPTLSLPLLSKIRNNILLEYADWTRNPYPILSNPETPISATNVTYAGTAPLATHLQFVDDTHYIVDNFEGELNKPFIHPAFTLTLQGSKPLSKQEFNLTLFPMEVIVQRIRPQFLVESDKSDKNLIRIKYFDSDRYRGSDYVNALMMAYQDHLNQEHHRIADTQLNYLEKRQNEIVANLRKVMEDYATNGDEEQTIHGFSALQKESESLARIQIETTHRLMDIDLEKARIQNILNGGKCVYYDRYNDRGDPAVINLILQQIRDYERQSDTLVATLDQTKIPESHEFAGMDLDAAKQLHINYSRDLSDVQASLKQHTYLISQIQEPDFEICSLGTMLQDPVSGERIAKASNLLLSLKDENNRTQKEQARIRQDLDLEKMFLTLHLKQTAQLLALKENLLIEKIHALHNASYDLTKQQISILRKHLADYLATRKDNLQQEKELLTAYQKQINENLNAIRNKLVSELLVDQHISLTQNMVEELTKLVESKNVSNNLELIQSAPVDIAVAPTHPQFPRLILKTILGAILGVLLGIGWIFLSVIRHGIPATPNNLNLAHEMVGGVISKVLQNPLKNTDLDTLRRVEHLLNRNQPQSILLLQGRGYDISPFFAKLFKERGQSTLIMPLNFHTAPNPQELPGLLQFIEGMGSTPKILRGEVFDRISSGGISRYSTELLLQPQFKFLLDKLHSEYNWIIGVCDAPLESAESEALLPLFDRTLVCVTEETIEQLQPYLERENPALFVFIENS